VGHERLNLANAGVLAMNDVRVVKQIVVVAPDECEAGSHTRFRSPWCAVGKAIRDPQAASEAAPCETLKMHFTHRRRLTCALREAQSVISLQE
jgi:hypothetical protein